VVDDDEDVDIGLGTFDLAASAELGERRALTASGSYVDAGLCAGGPPRLLIVVMTSRGWKGRVRIQVEFVW
jgi:hypothetical protein